MSSFLSDRILSSNESITLKLNSKAEALRKEGKKVYNLTAGQLPYRPSSNLITNIEKQLNLLSSYQYSPAAGRVDVKEKVIKYFEDTRDLSLPRDEYSAILSTGAKQSIFNAVGATINPGDEVLLFAPYWISYPEIIKYWQGVPVVIEPHTSVTAAPQIEEIEAKITNKTKMIMLNSPGNPSGVFYEESWIQEFSQMLSKYPNILLVSDEIYFKLNYYDPTPRYPYQFDSELLKRTLLVDGISKSMACTGLRIGFTVGPKEIIKGMSVLQGQSTSGANSLVQGALSEYDFADIDSYLAPVKNHLRVNSEIVKERMQYFRIDKAWYQTNSAFYFFLDFSKMPIIKKFKKNDSDDTDYAFQICEELISETGVVVVPGTDFGIKNSARMSLVLERKVFTEAVDLLFDYLSRD